MHLPALVGPAALVPSGVGVHTDGRFDHVTGKKAWAVVLAAIVLLAPACGGGDGTGASGDGHEDHAAGSHDHHDSSNSGTAFAFGEPADPSDADRTIEVAGTDELRFQPDVLEVEAGETIAFEFKNAGDMPHEFVLGDKASLEAHVHGGDQPNGTGEVPGGGTETIAWTFSEAGEFSYECHVDKHHEAGMRGTITVK